MPVNAILPCVVCKTGQVRFQVKNLRNGRTANICSIKCLLSWCLGFSLGGIRGAVQKLLAGVPK